MRFDIMTLFPDLVTHVLGESIIGRAQKSGACDIYAHNIRDYSEDKNRRVDDTPYGGGMGMLMAAPPIYNCYCGVLKKQLEQGFDGRRHVIYLSPTGKVLTQKKAEELAASYDNLILLCGHYEGVDRRIVEEIVDEEISIGDYVLTGGEIPACILVDCVARLTDGVLSASECYENESISSGLLEYPQYTRPLDYHGMKVPAVLTSGDHKKIDEWRREAAMELTRRNRPDLLPAEDAETKDTPQKSPQN
ncbi:MAG: tRNA (guanosine(37)-N1)-methyltransferase TrmD [Clostridia bacterium]|nr:tRNA (guanosine(37)-N1)-methyltransferase TrmD [Clostridia bacterium]MBQ7316926.1 tRNA (guanosine(37)-N1)-methyltransferase TrmD [Clostridia bacterium]